MKLITSNQKTFEEVATDTSEDQTSAKVNGDIGYVPRTSESPVGQRFVSILGQDFLNTLIA